MKVAKNVFSTSRFRHNNNDHYSLKADRNIFYTQRSIVLIHHAGLEISMEKCLDTDRILFLFVEPYRVFQRLVLNEAVLD